MPVDLCAPLETALHTLQGMYSMYSAYALAFALAYLQTCKRWNEWQRMARVLTDTTRQSLRASLSWTLCGMFNVSQTNSKHLGTHLLICEGAKKHMAPSWHGFIGSVSHTHLDGTFPQKKPFVCRTILVYACAKREEDSRKCLPRSTADWTPATHVTHETARRHERDKTKNPGTRK